MANEPKAPAAAQISFEHFTETTIAAVLRAVEAQKLPHRPIIIGIIWNPQLNPEAMQGGPQGGVK